MAIPALLHWFDSHVQNRYQVTKIGKKYSHELEVKMVIPKVMY